MNDPFDLFERYTVTWHVDVAKMHGVKRKLSLGICAKTGGVAFASEDYLHPLIIRDVIVNSKLGRCGDAQWCVDLSCPFNKADLKKMRNYAVKTTVELKRLHERLEDIKTKLKLTNADNSCTQLVYKKPAVILRRVPKDDLLQH